MKTALAGKTERVASVLGASSGYLGPGEVVASAASTVRVRITGGEEVAAELALAFPFRPSKGDVLLVIGKDDAYFVIGVLAGAGRTVLEFSGDVELRSLTGKVEISGARGVSLQSPVIEIGAEKLKIVAHAVTETMTTLFSRVRDVMTVHAGESRSLVKGHSYAQSKRAQINTEETVSINGREIHLG